MTVRKEQIAPARMKRIRFIHVGPVHRKGRVQQNRGNPLLAAIRAGSIQTKCPLAVDPAKTLIVAHRGVGNPLKPGERPTRTFHHHDRVRCAIENVPELCCRVSKEDGSVVVGVVKRRVDDI